LTIVVLLGQVLPDVSDRGGNVEECIVRIGTLELLESVAWLLEKIMVEAIGF
jgi:hypothetical protein